MLIMKVYDLLWFLPTNVYLSLHPERRPKVSVTECLLYVNLYSNL